MNHDHHHIASRRSFLQRTGLAVGGASLAPLLMTPGIARAADYKALVCVFLYGGNDGNNTIVPTDAARHGAYSAARGVLALPRAGLLGLSGTEYGLHPSLAALQPLWGQGQLAAVFNTGPLAMPLTKAQWVSASQTGVGIPESLFSHSDQQLLWECAGTSILAREGWGARAADALATTNPVISVGGNGRFGVSATRLPLVVPGPGSFFGAHGTQPDDLRWAPVAARKAALDALYAQDTGSKLGNAYAGQTREAFVVSQRLSGIVGAAPGAKPEYAAIDRAFAPITSGGRITTPLGNQLYQAAKLIASNATVQGSRQLFFAQLGGFDTHAGQVITGSPAQGQHAGLLKQLGDALAAFQKAMNDIGMGQAVTTFTQADFGRTLAFNNSTGSDHAWGNHHLVLGGAVRGGLYGRYPELTLGGPDDVGVEAWDRQGRWIPTTSVEQYAATLLGWLGAADAQLDAVLPNLRKFATRKLAFV
jgi:uncharacterized protein (DUF1501 family)